MDEYAGFALSVGPVDFAQDPLHLAPATNEFNGASRRNFLRSADKENFVVAAAPRVAAAFLSHRTAAAASAWGEIKPRKVPAGRLATNGRQQAGRFSRKQFEAGVSSAGDKGSPVARRQ